MQNRIAKMSLYCCTVCWELVTHHNWTLLKGIRRRHQSMNYTAQNKACWGSTFETSITHAHTGMIFVQRARKTLQGTCEVTFVQPLFPWMRKNKASSAYSWGTRHRQQYQNTECCWRELLRRIYVAGNPEYLGNVELKLAGQLARHGTVQQFVGPEPALGVSRQNTKKNIKCWLGTNTWQCGRVLTSTQRRALDLIRS